jgi:riboflavin kinase/FMN adenylyltransferase
MIIHKGYENLNLITPIVTLGIFDGVHLGHKTLLNHLVARAKEEKGESVVITFSPHPRLVLDINRNNLTFLTTMEEKVVLLEETKIDHLVIIEFNNKFSNIPACDFINEVLVEKIGTKHLLIGYNHHFGRNGEGDFDMIKKCTESLDFKVERMNSFSTGNSVISSSLIRQALSAGRPDEANSWLGYPYSVSGTVIEGRHIGRSIGFPTANIRPDYQYKLIPGDGVYAVEVKLGGLIYPGMLSIGSNPTVNEDPGNKSIEVNILGFDEDIYGKVITVIFRKKLRNEMKFENTDQLARQIMLDKKEVLLLFR